MVKDLLLRLGLASLARPLLGGAGAILVFHRIRAADPALAFATNYRNNVPPDAFGRLLDTLAEDGIEVVGLEEALLRQQTAGTGRFVCLTFDDGYRDNHDTLLPIVEARRVPITVYVAPGLIDGSAPLWWYALEEVIAREPRVRLPLPEDTELATGDRPAKQQAFDAAGAFMLTAAPEASARMTGALAVRYGVDFAALAARHMMSWDMVRRLATCPMVEIGAHSVSHPSLATLDEATALHEMAGSRSRLEREIGRPVRHFAYPYGSRTTMGVREVRFAAQLGFRTAVTTLPGNLRRGDVAARHRWPRHGIGPHDGPTALRLKLAGLRNPLWRG
jgi:peptidoglycan/xylan/chitin deacetylase (PgdA/CDA1 family)